MLGVKEISFEHHPRPTVPFDENEVPIVDKLLADIATTSECCYDAVSPVIPDPASVE